MTTDRKAFLRRTETCWTVTFTGHDTLPNGEPLPLPFAASAPADRVAAHVRAKFPGHAIRGIGESW